MSIRPLRTNFSRILVKIHFFSFTRMHLKISHAKWRPFSPGGDEPSLDPYIEHICPLIRISSQQCCCVTKARVINADIHALELVLDDLEEAYDVFFAWHVALYRQKAPGAIKWLWKLLHVEWGVENANNIGKISRIIIWGVITFQMRFYIRSIFTTISPLGNHQYLCHWQYENSAVKS